MEAKAILGRALLAWWAGPGVGIGKGVPPRLHQSRKAALRRWACGR